MMHQRYMILGAALLISAFAALKAYDWLYPAKTSVKLVFHAEVDGSPFQRNEFAYSNPGGDGQFRIRDFRFYLSNFRLEGSDGLIQSIPDSYHLARFDNAENSYVLEFDDLPVQQLQSISFAIGVDAAANTSIQTRGDLDPNSQMAWNWKVGYKFVLFEGAMQRDGKQTPLVYHVGFSDNMRRLTFDMATPMELVQGAQLDFTVDVMKLFDSTSTVDMARLSSVKFDKADARMLAENYRTMIALKAQ
jgi:hypothetical protein